MNTKNSNSKKVQLKEILSGSLTIIGTPIGNIMDLSPRAIQKFQGADLVLCEDTRITKKLANLRSFKIKKLVSFNNYNEKNKQEYVMDKIKDGKNIVLTSDAGMPLISDPGFGLLKECIENNIKIETVPGPSASIAALVVSGLSTQNFYFAGFPNKKKLARINDLKQLIDLNATLIWYESPKRLLGFLKDLKLVFGNRKAVIVKELTKLYEEVLRGDLLNLITEIETRKQLKGEYVVVVEKPVISKTLFVDDDIKNQINILLETKSLKSVVEILVNKTNLPKNIIYNAALKIKNNKPIN